MRSPIEPWTFTVKGKQAVSLFTDDDLLERFFEEQDAGPNLSRAVFKNKDELLQFLVIQLNATKSGIRITHVLIDPGDPPTPLICYSIVEFAEHVASS